MEDFPLEVDHVVFYASRDATGCLLAERLYLLCSDRLIPHPSQGTASNLIFFENAYLEVVQVKDPILAAQYKNQAGVDLISRSRWYETLASPFGIALRSKLRNKTSPHLLEADGYQPGPADTSVFFDPDNLSTAHEPICFLVPSAAALSTLLDLSSKAHQRLVAHPLGVRRITKIEITIPRLGQWSQVLHLIAYQELVTFKQGLLPLLELTFDDGHRNCTIDVRPNFPIILKY
ncbi:MAG: VOC family protein [Elainellaceae cyanobacterium]